MTAQDELAQWFADRRVGGVALVVSPEDYETAEALIAAGWRKMPSIAQIADQVMLNAIYHGREGSVMTDESRDDFEYDRALQTAHAILALMDGENE